MHHARRRRDRRAGESERTFPLLSERSLSDARDPARQLSYDDPDVAYDDDGAPRANPTPAAARRFLAGVEYVSLVAFTAEVVVKVVACGERPSAFATDPEDGAFNLFDLAIVVVSIGFAATGGSGSTVAVGRLLRLVKVVLKIPQLRFVLLGFAAGLRAVVPIMLLMLLIIYLCARDLVGGGARALRSLRI